MFRILVVDDNPVEVQLLEAVLRGLSRPYRLDWAKDGVAALEYLSADPCDTPGLILMDVNMPRLNGLQTLIAIKSDPKLRAIPVIMLSTSAVSEEIRNLYEAHANCFVQKPADMSRSRQLMRAIEAFWMDFAVLPHHVARPMDGKGTSVARVTAEVSRPAMQLDGSRDSIGGSTRSLRCEEHRRLMEQFAESVKELLNLHQQQFEAAVKGDAECNRFDLLIHMANEKKQRAKYDYLRHVESHGCSNLDVITNASGT